MADEKNPAQNEQSAPAAPTPEQEAAQAAQAQAAAEANQNNQSDIGVWSTYAPTAVGGWSKDELEQGVSFQPNWYSRYMPTWLGGMSTDEINRRDTAAEQAGYISRPNVYQRYMPAWLGGYSQDDVDKYDNMVQQYNLIDPVTTYERYMPTWLGGKTDEQIQEYDQKKAELNGPQKAGWWKTNMPTWLGGASNEELAQMEQNAQAYTQGQEILKGVSLGELSEICTPEQIQALQEKAAAIQKGALAEQAQGNGMGLRNRFGHVEGGTTITSQTMLEMGLSNSQVRAILRAAETQSPYETARAELFAPAVPVVPGKADDDSQQQNPNAMAIARNAGGRGA